MVVLSTFYGHFEILTYNGGRGASARTWKSKIQFFCSFLPISGFNMNLARSYHLAKVRIPIWPLHAPGYYIPYALLI